jgi:pimeloyl-ACP methyl ester carboxylesterase
MAMQEQEIRFRSDGLELAGTLALPDKGSSFPGVLLIAGSGQVDRNENHQKLRLNIFYDIAHYLAQNGIASLRYDKRGVGQSGGSYWSAGFSNNVQDALAALQYLRNHKKIQPQKVFLLGHSEGALIATRLAGLGAEVAGVILLAGSARSGEEVLQWQVLQVARGLKGINGWLINKLHVDVAKAQAKQLEKIKASRQDWIREQLFVKLNAKWLREFMAYNPADDLPYISVPVLAITGSKDIQVDPADLERMAQLVQAPFEHHVIPNMTHILRSEAGEAAIARYKEEIKQPMEPQVLELVLHWLRQQLQPAVKSR